MGLHFAVISNSIELRPEILFFFLFCNGRGMQRMIGVYPTTQFINHHGKRPTTVEDHFLHSLETRVSQRQWWWGKGKTKRFQKFLALVWWLFQLLIWIVEVPESRLRLRVNHNRGRIIIRGNKGDAGRQSFIGDLLMPFNNWEDHKVN